MPNKYIFILGIFAPSFLLAAKGEIIHENGDYYVVNTGHGCSVIEWRGGYIPSEGEELVGNLDSYGLKKIYNISNGKEIRVYVEDYLLDEDDAVEIAYDLGGEDSDIGCQFCFL